MSEITQTLPIASNALAITQDGQTADIAVRPLPKIDEIRQWLIAKLAECTALLPDEISIYEPFSQYGLGSVDAVSLSGELEEWLDCTLSPTLLYDYPSIDALARHLVGEEAVAAATAIVNGYDAKSLAEPIAIVGIGCRFPGHAHSPETFWQLLKEGTLATSEVSAERWDINAYYDPDPDAPGKMYTRYGGFLENIAQFDASFFGISPREAVRMDPQQRLLAEVSWEALEHAGIPASTLAGSRTGVFIGMMNNLEYTHLQMLQGEGEHFDDPYFSMGSASSVAAGRLAYLFDLQGPTITVDTACSSSLVCVHLASQSLRNGECNLALVGGVNAILLPESMVNACKMGMLAHDGRCKTFGADADGFVLGEGCGVVVLKRLSDALNENNPILAVIRGSAVNQDGQSNGLTAPNKLAQEAVIRQALRVTNVEPEQVSYVEAHGSGTPLGDPIEIGALTSVLYENRPSDQPLIVGSVKTNIGHLAGAAGIAGLIKTVLALHHQEIPAHLNLHELNPHIGRQAHQVHIPRETMPWTVTQGPRIAGVNSFGWSGTNAHVVLEEAVANPRTSDPAAPWQVFVLSAKTEHALEAQTQQLMTSIKERQNTNLADLAYSYQVSRSILPYRRTLVCKDAEDALQVLENRSSQRIFDGIHQSGTPTLTFMFPGLGDHYEYMGWQLYQSEPVFRQSMDQCAEILQPLLQRDIRDLLYPDLKQQSKQDRSSIEPTTKIDLRQMLKREVEPNSITEKELYQTQFAHPVLFAVEYALARLWLSWGVQPQAMIGYSLGEYVAVCLAGVLNLTDVLRLVALRASLIQSLPTGSMMAVALPEEQVLPLLGSDLSLAAVNGPMMCVVGGPLEAVQILERSLSHRGIACQRLHTTHAFHTAMMRPLIEPLTKLVATFDLRAPRVPFISNVTGTWITVDQVFDPGYWASHMCETIRLADGLDKVWHSASNVLVEVGPGQFLSSLAMQHPASREATQKLFLRSLRHTNEKCADRELLLGAVGQLWAAGGTLDWAGMHAHEQRQIVPLPTYPFERRHYWVEKKKEASQRPNQHRNEKLTDLADWFYVPVWKRSQSLQPSQMISRVAQDMCWLIFADPCGIATRIAESLQAQGQQVTLVKEGEAFRRLDDDVYTIHPAERSDYDALLKHLKAINRTPEHIVHMWNVTGERHSPLASSDLDAAQRSGFYSLLYLAQALGNLHPTPTALQLDVLSSGLYEVVGGDQYYPEKATLLGPCKVIPREYPQIRCRNIDLPIPAPTFATASLQQQKLAQQLVQELWSDRAEEVVAYRGIHRWIQSFEPAPLPATDHPTPLCEQGVYLITGGLGGLGGALAHYLARTVRARLVLVGRTALPQREDWNAWLSEHDEQDRISQKIRHIQDLEELGASVLFARADVADLTEMQHVITLAHDRFGAIRGVIHAAGTPGEGLMQLKTPSQVEAVFAPKLRGTITLEQALRDEPLDFAVFYSSSNAVTGGFGEVDYCAANAFLDAFAHYQTAKVSYPVIAINWGPWQWDAWQEKVFTSLPEVYAQIKAFRARYGITFAEGEEAWKRILSTPSPQFMVLPQGFQTALEHANALASLTFLTDQEPKQSSKPLDLRPQLRTPYVAPRNENELKMAAIWQEALGIEHVGIHDHFFELGGNSLIGLMLVSRVKKLFDVQLSAAHLFEGPTISMLLDLMYPSQQEQPTLDNHSTRGKLRRDRLKKLKHSV